MFSKRLRGVNHSVPESVSEEIGTLQQLSKRDRDFHHFNRELRRLKLIT